MSHEVRLRLPISDDALTRAFSPLLRAMATLLVLQLVLAGAAYKVPQLDHWHAAVVTLVMAVPLGLLVLATLRDSRLASYRFQIALIGVTWLAQVGLLAHAFLSNAVSCVALVALAITGALSLQTNPLAIWPTSLQSD